MSTESNAQVFYFFKKWFQTADFKHKLSIEKKTSKSLILKFNNLLPYIVPVVSDGGINVCAVFDECNYDIMWWYDVWPKTDSGGFINESLLEEYRIKHTSLEEMYIKECFESFRDWVNSLNKHDYLFLQNFGGSTQAFIQPTMIPERNRSKKDYGYTVAIFRLDCLEMNKKYKKE